MKGYVKNLVIERGFGFIACPDETRDYFFHFSNLAEGIEFDETLQGRRVCFELKETPKGEQAVGIEPDDGLDES